MSVRRFQTSSLPLRILGVFSSTAAFVACAAIVHPAFSAPPDFAQAPAETAWIVHADLDALHKSVVYRRLAAALARWQPLADNLARINRQLGMDLNKDVRGMTIFGPDFSEKGVLLMWADWDPQTFRQRLVLAASHDVSTYGHYEIHRFARRDQDQYRSLYGVCWQPGTFVFGKTRDEVQSLLDVLDGRRPNLAAGKSPLAAAVAPGTVLLVRIVATGDALPGESPLFKGAVQIDLACGEDSGECFVRGRLTAKNAEAAEQIKKAVDGLLALARLGANADDDGRKLLERVDIRAEGRVVRLDFRIPAEELAVQLGKLVERSERAK